MHRLKYDGWVEHPMYVDEEDELETIDKQPLNYQTYEKENNMSDKKEMTMNEAFIAASLEFEPLAFNKKVKYGATTFDYADLSEILKCIRVPLLNHGFIIKHEFAYESDKLLLKTLIKYKTDEIYSQSVYPIDIANKKMQDIGTQITYMKRYHLAAMCNLCADADNDAIEIKDETLNKTIDESEVKVLNSYLSKLSANERVNIFNALKTKDLSKLTKIKYPAALEFVKNFIESKQRENNENRNSRVL